MPASSLLMLILMLWSIPMLIYAILFSRELKQFVPELKQLVSEFVRAIRSGESNPAGERVLFEYLLPMVAAATLALMYGLVVGVSWPICLMLMAAAAALIGGMAFTLLHFSKCTPSDKTLIVPGRVAGNRVSL